jgi:hypothetical protein
MSSAVHSFQHGLLVAQYLGFGEPSVGLGQVSCEQRLDCSSGWVASNVQLAATLALSEAVELLGSGFSFLL